MRKILCAACIVLAFQTGVHAMNLDGVKRHFLAGEWKTGIREGEALLAKAKRNSAGLDELYYYLALCYLKDGNYLRTSDICEILLNEFPRTRFREQAHFVLIEAYDRNGNAQQALKYAQDFLKKYPDSVHRKDVKTRQARLKARQAVEPAAVVVAPSPTISAPMPAMPASVAAAPVPAAVAVESAVHVPPAPRQEDIDIVLAPGIRQQAAAQPAEQGRQFWVQVGAFSSNKNAGNLAKKLRAVSYKASVIKSTLNNRDVFKVRVGPYYSKDDVDSVSVKLSRQGYSTKIIP